MDGPNSLLTYPSGSCIAESTSSNHDNHHNRRRNRHLHFTPRSEALLETPIPFHPVQSSPVPLQRILSRP